MHSYFNLLYDNNYILSLVSFLLCITCIKLFMSFSHNLKLIDKPNLRKKHTNDTPLIGGIAIYCTFSVVFAPTFLQNFEYFAFWMASFILVAICIIDDIKNIKVSSRFATQLFTIAIIIIFGKTTLFNLGNLLGIGDIKLGWLSVPFTVFTLIGVINAVNMMDGIDGLTGCVSLVELSLMAFLALLIGAKAEFSVIIILISCIVGFLFFNFPSKFLKNKIFLGDAGSMLIGLVLGWLTIRLTQGPNKIPPALMLWIMSLPLMDTVHLIFNRKARGLSPFKADRRHIHHILLQLGFSHMQTPVVLMLTSLCIGGTGLGLFINGASDATLFTGIILVFFTYLKVAIYLKKKVVTTKYKPILT